MKEIKNAVFEALGAASMCWKPIPSGVFDSTKAQEIGNELMEKIAKSYVEVPCVPKKCQHYGDGLQSNEGCPGSINTRHCPNNTNEDCDIVTQSSKPVEHCPYSPGNCGRIVNKMTLPDTGEDKGGK